MNFKGSILGPFLMPIFGPRAYDLVLKSKICFRPESN